MIRNSNNQNICGTSLAHLINTLAVISDANRRTLDKAAELCHTTYVLMRDTPMRVKLKDTTFVLGDKPMRTLLWCNKVPKSKRNKPAKINGIQHSEISDAMEHTYYQPVN